MPKYLLHIGMHKTGSTSIQNSLKDLDGKDFYYARLRGRPNHSNSMSAIFAQSDASHIAKKARRKGKSDIDEMKRESRRDLKASIEAAGARTLVISGEGMLRMTEAELGEMKSFLERKDCSGIEVIGYVRAPGSYISSALQQKIKTGHLAQINLMSSVPVYRNSFEKFDRVFGRENVRLHKFDPAAFANGDVVQDFCSRIGMAPDSVSPVRKNDSISRLSAQLLFQYARLAKDDGLKPMRGGMGVMLAARLKSLDPAPFRMAPSVLASCVDEIRHDVDWMENRLGASLQETGVADRPGDIVSEDDLLAPVPDIEDKLRALLAESGEAAEVTGTAGVWDLLYRMAKAEVRAKKSGSGEDGEAGDGGTQGGERRARRLARRNTAEPGNAPAADDAHESREEKRARRKARRAAE